MKNSLRFIKYLFDEEVEFEDEYKEVYNRPKKGDVAISKKGLFSRYEKWCSENGEQSIMKKNFVSIIESFGLVEIYAEQQGGDKFRAYVLEKTAVLALFRKFLLSPTFEFTQPVQPEDEDSEPEDD